MIANVRARYSNGVLEPLEMLDLKEGQEVLVSIEESPSPDVEAPSVLEMFNKLHRSAPKDAWVGGPTDGAKNYKHCLYGWPRDDAP